MKARILLANLFLRLAAILLFTGGAALADEPSNWLTMNGAVATIDYSAIEAKMALAVARQLGLPDAELKRVISPRRGFDRDAFDEFDLKKSERQYFSDVDSMREKYIASAVGFLFVLTDMEAELSSYDFDQGLYYLTIKRVVNGNAEARNWDQGSTSLHYSNGINVVASLPGKEVAALRTVIILEMDENEASKLSDLTKEGVKIRADCGGVRLYNSGNGPSFDCFATELVVKNKAGFPLIRITRTSATEGRVKVLFAK